MFLGLPGMQGLTGFATLSVCAISVGLLCYKRYSQQQQQEQQQAARAAALKSASQEALLRPSLDDPNSLRKRVRVLFGTQTGTAERFAKQIGGELRKHHGESTTVDVIDLESYSAERQLAREKLVVLCVATYGDGEPTDNAADFFSWLSKEVEAVNAGEKEPFLQGTTYAVFGLGNKQYEHFNAIGKKAFSALQALGAVPLLRRGDGDDDGCIDDDFDKWSGEFAEALKGRADLVGATQHVSSDQPIEVPCYLVEEFPPGTAEDPAFPLDGTGRDHHSPFWATVTEVRQLHTPESGRSCVHVELDVSGMSSPSTTAPDFNSPACNGNIAYSNGNGALTPNGVHHATSASASSVTSSSSGGAGGGGEACSSGVVYEHGDHVAVYGQNAPAVVQEIAERLGRPLNMVLSLSMPEGSVDRLPPFTGRLSLRTALTLFADVLSSPHKDVLASLSTFASNADEAKQLRRMADHEGKGLYADFIAKPHRSLLEVLRAFPSVKPSLGAFFGCIAPRMQPRFYSISSSPKAHPRAVHITASVVRDVMPTGRVHEGIATTFLQNAPVGTKVPSFIRHSHFKLPSNPEVPVIMVGPGTGLAPFRGFLQERAALRKSGCSLGPAMLFFGCRHSQHDNLYQEELAKHLAAGELSELHVAFSREGPQKDYVQHRIAREADRVWDLLAKQQGYLYVCGDAKAMAKDVHKTLVAITQEHMHCSGTQAETWIKEHLHDTGRYQRDVW